MSSSIDLNLFTQRRLRRERTISSDSGCCLGEAAPLITDREELDNLLEELTLIWMDKIETAMMRGVAKLKENVSPEEKCKALRMFEEILIDYF